jgi:hippurate hydrolase
MVPACALVMELQTIVSRRLSPSDVAVVSVTELVTDGLRNALPGHARILGDARSYSPAVSARIEEEMRRITRGIAESYAIDSTVVYKREFVPLVNDAEVTQEAVLAAQDVSTHVNGSAEAITASEDFARFLDHVPGCFLLIGNGEGSAPLHNPTFDFNDEALLHGARLHAAIVRRRLAKS